MSKKPIEHSINFLPKINKIPLLLIAVLFTGSLWAQAVNRQISGVVKNTDNKSLSGASVLIIGEKTGTFTNADGTFTLDVKNDADTLLVSFIGYNSKKVVVGSNSALNIVLERNEKDNELDQVVVVGYGTQKKISVTGGVDVVAGDKLTSRAVPNVTQALAQLAAKEDLIPH